MLMMVIGHALGLPQRRLYFWIVYLIRCLWTLVSLFLFICRCYTFVLEAAQFLLFNLLRLELFHSSILDFPLMFGLIAARSM